MPPLLISWNGKMPFVLFKVIQGVLECDCVAEKGCQGTDKHVSSTSSQPTLESKTLPDPYIMYTIKDMAVMYSECISHTVKLEAVIGYLVIGPLCLFPKGVFSLHTKFSQMKTPELTFPQVFLLCFAGGKCCFIADQMSFSCEFKDVNAAATLCENS